MKRAFLLLVALGSVGCNQPEPAPLAMAQTVAEPTVYVTRYGHRYHTANCTHAGRNLVPMALSEAKGKGYSPCYYCELGR